jgi:hypothetical protein
MMNGIKIIVVLIMVVVLTSISIDAFDTASGSRLTLLAQLGSLYRGSKCPADMTLVTTAVQPFCIDTYEASPAPGCPVMEPNSSLDTERDMQAGGCRPNTATGQLPWRYVSYQQAETLCARAGKRLPEPREWYDAALGTPTTMNDCQLVGEVAHTGNKSLCVSGVGAFDMVGNVWEYLAGIGSDGTFGTYTVPKEGYVALVDDEGLPRETMDTPPADYGADYVWSKNSGATVRARGGFYGAREDGGIYSMQAGVSPTFVSSAIGFRCARSL